MLSSVCAGSCPRGLAYLPAWLSLLVWGTVLFFFFWKFFFWKFYFQKKIENCTMFSSFRGVSFLYESCVRPCESLAAYNHFNPVSGFERFSAPS